MFQEAYSDATAWSAGGLRLWHDFKGLVPLLECSSIVADQFILSGWTGQGVRGVLRDQMRGHWRSVCGEHTTPWKFQNVSVHQADLSSSGGLPITLQGRAVARAACWLLQP